VAVQPHAELIADRSPSGGADGLSVAVDSGIAEHPQIAT
jgi:hypothetical protein